MYQKTCGATTGSCSEPEVENNPIFLQKSTKDDENPLKNIDCSDFPIVKAVQYGAQDRVLQLINEGVDVNKPDDENISLLHWASINNRREIIKLLLEKGADVNVIGGDLNSSPIHWAVRQGHLASTVLLLKAGADATLQDAEGKFFIFAKNILN
jgi:palmitoyltransferase